MLFNSLTFIAFFAVVLAFHYAPLTWTSKKVNLLIASYLFYAAWNPPFVLLLWLSTVVDWHVAKWIYSANSKAQKRAFLILSLLTNLGILCYFKYGGFLLANWVELMRLVGVEYVTPDWSIILPVGISFYTFQTMAYSLDIYLGRAKPAKSLLDFSLFVTFFPQLVAGPIVRPTQLIPQFAIPHLASKQQFGWGLSLIVLGLFQKVVIADGFLAPVAEMVFDSRAPVATLDAWVGTLAFAGQIFSDFAGYSTTAIGVALCLGFSLPTNFRFPYAALGFSDFWRRWHISLSTWLRDYLYIPLGGNQQGLVRTYINLMLTMLLGGLWHGANWNFVIWGGLHGIFLASERFVNNNFSLSHLAKNVPLKFTYWLVTFIAINVTWVFFRAKDFPSAITLVTSMFGFSAEKSATPVPYLYLLEVSLIMSLLVIAHWQMRNTSLEQVVAKLPAWLISVLLFAMGFLIIISQGSGDAFIYFQF
ncbi:MBOAT family O-acyltransferase [Aliikangiella sp. IMCC44653]